MAVRGCSDAIRACIWETSAVITFRDRLLSLLDVVKENNEWKINER